MAKIKKGDRLICVPCGRRVSVSLGGVAETAIWCCGRPMQKKEKAKITKKTSRKRKTSKKK